MDRIKGIYFFYPDYPNILLFFDMECSGIEPLTSTMPS